MDTTPSATDVLDQRAKSVQRTTPSLQGVSPDRPITPPAPAQPKADSLTPRTDAALSIPKPAPPKDVPSRDVLGEMEAEYRKRNEQPGVPLDVETGASPWERFMLSFRREKENQVKYLQGKYGQDNVRIDDEGELVVRVVDSKTGKPKDMLVKEHEMSAKDLIDLAGTVPEIAGGIIALRKGKGIPVLGKAKGLLGLQRDVAATAIGAETAGAVKDVATGLVDEGKADVPKIAKERAGMAATDVAIGEASMGIGKLFNFLKAPLHGSRGPVQFDALAAQKYFKEKYGVEVPLSIGESTGSPLVSRTEAFMEKLPGGGTPFKELKGKQEEALRQLQGIMMGKTPTTDEAVGKKTIDTLMEKIAPKEEAVASSQKQLQKVGTRNIENIIGGVTLPERQVFRSETGKEIREAVVAKRDAAKAEADRLYGVVRSLPGGEGKVFEAGGLQDRFKKILDSLPAPEQTVEVPTEILGPTGEPIMRTETGSKVLREFVPPNVLSRLQAVANLKDAKVSLSDLQQMRREVYDDIAKGEGVPGLGTHYLNDIGKAITAAMDEGIDKLPGGELKTALAAANKHYKEEVIPFNRHGITELFRAPDEAGHISDSEVISRIFSGGKSVERYNLMKETLGETSDQFSKLKRSIADRLLEDSRHPGDELLDAGKVLNNFAQLRRDAPEIANDIFGGKLNEVFRQARLMAYGKDPKIDSLELKMLLKDKSPTAKALKTLVDDQANLDRLYKNEILNSVASGQLPKNEINPVEFVNRFLGDAKPSDIKSIMYMIRDKPELVEDLRAKTVEKIFRDAARNATPGDIGKLLSGDPTRIVSGTSVFKQIEAGTTRDKIRSILGPEIFKDLENYIRIEAAGEAKETSFKAAGGLAAGMQIANLTRRGPLRYMYEAGKDWIVSSLMTRAPLRQWLSNIPASNEPGALSLILSSPPFLEAVAKEFPGAKGSMFISAIKNSVDRWLGKQPQEQPQAPQPARMNAGEFLNRVAGQRAQAQDGQPEQITAAAYRTADGKVETGPHHPGILKRLGVKGYETRESRNTPQFGFVTSSGRFVTREEAGKLATASGQNLETFDEGEPVHSDQIESPRKTGKPISESPPP